MAVLIIRPNNANKSDGTILDVSKINETTADDDAGYLEKVIPNNNSDSEIWTIGNFQPLIQGIKDSKFSITEAKIFFRAKLSSENQSTTASIDSIKVNINNTNFNIKSNFSITSPTYNNFNAPFVAKSIKTLNSYIKNNKKMPPITVTFTLSGSHSDYKSSAPNIRLTQAYIELTYSGTLPEGEAKNKILIKRANTWQEFHKVYQKVNGVWLETDPNKLFNSLQNGQIISYIDGGSK